MKGFEWIKIILGLLIVIPASKASGQVSDVLTVDAFMQQLRQFHPVIKQADLIRENASANLLSARGAFDPVFEMNSNNKTLDGVNYYRYSQPELKLPTTLGVDVKTGFENTSGQYTNPERTNGTASYIGIEVPLINGLLMDKRRAVLQQAKIFKQQSEQERQAIINDLLFTAYTSYWEWTSAYQLYNLYSRYVELATNRSRLVNIAFQNGDRAVADTIEAFAQQQSYSLLQANAFMELKNKTLELSQFLWSGDGEPFLLPSSSRPDTNQFIVSVPLPDTTRLAEELELNHPLLRTTQFKLEALEVERKLKFQSLLPVVNLQANLLSKEYFNYDKLSIYYLENNYKLGVNLKVPLFIRQGRGDYKSVRVKIKDTQLELSRKTWELQTKLRQYYNEASQLREQLEMSKIMRKNYNSLLNLEELKFSQGESSLFLVNSRQNKTLEMEQKVIELQMKYLKAIYTLQWVAATIN